MTTKQIIEEWLDETQIDLVKNYRKLGLKASGNWAEALEQFYGEQRGSVRFGILGAKYTGAIENGRRRNRDQSASGLKKWVGWAGSTFLKQWVKDKGLNLNPYAVAWKIARQGWKVPNKHNAGGLVSDVITEERINVLGKKIIGNMIVDFRSNVIKDFKNVN